jgi:hypothetical protein
VLAFRKIRSDSLYTYVHVKTRELRSPQHFFGLRRELRFNEVYGLFR